jgi:hypothetical protein
MVNNELQGTWKEPVVVCLMVQFYLMSGGIQGNHRTFVKPANFRPFSNLTIQFFLE